jgi:hypothetical protein
VALFVLDMFIEPKVQRRLRIRGGDDIPASSAARDMVE